MEDCDHDWRINPHIVLLSYPPRVKLFCLKCKETRTALHPGYVRDNQSVEGWPKYEEVTDEAKGA